MIARRFVPLLATFSLLVVMFIIGGFQFEGFASLQVVTNLLTDNAFLLVVALGMTLVILSGGIDLSVGAVVALSGVLCAVLISEYQWHPLLVFPLVLVIGTLFGTLMGSLIYFYKLQPFIVTLAGMFFARGLATTISEESVGIEHPLYYAVADSGIALPGNAWLPSYAIIVIAVLAGLFLLTHYSRFGGYIYAIGGNSQSAALMGVPIARSTIGIYAMSSFLAAFAGILYTFYTFSGYALTGIGMELDAIAAVVIGGTLLTGGSGYILGTLLGVMLMGIIQTYIIFEGTLNSWWARIAIGLLLFVFIALQKVLNRSSQRG